MAVKKAEPVKKPRARKTAQKGESYACEVCGLLVTVDEDCGCVEACDIICCGEPMKQRASGLKATPKKAMTK